MLKNTIFTGLTTLILVALSSQSYALEKFEAAQSFNASSVLPANLLSGPNHQVGSVVTNDGFLNIYTIN